MLVSARGNESSASSVIVKVQCDTFVGYYHAVICKNTHDANILCEMHSHGNMSAFWSRTDDADEQGARIYAVIGRLDTVPEIHVRVGAYGYWHPLPVTAVFTGAGGFTDLYHEENESCPSIQPSM